MLQKIGDVQQGFLCPQCHQDMSNMEMLQTHYQTVHMKQPSATSKGFFSSAKARILGVQDNLKNSNDPSKIYAQYFSVNANHNHSNQEYMGYALSYNETFKRVRKCKLDGISNIATQMLLRLELLTNINEHIPQNRNTKERRKYEQGIIAWMEDSIASVCPTCKKSFGLTRRKHHCRLDGSVICHSCSHLLSFSTAQFLNDWNVSSATNTGIFQRLTSITSMATTHDGSTEECLRICQSCAQFLQRRYDRLRFNNIEMDKALRYYEKIIEIRKEFDTIHPTYTSIIDSLLSGDSKYQIIDAQHLYRQSTACYDKINSASKLIVALADSVSDINGIVKPCETRYASLCQNIRTYSVQLLQNCAISIKRVPSEDDIKRARNERIAKDQLTLTGTTPVSGWKPSIDRDLLEKNTEELDPIAQQYYQIQQFIQQAEKAGRNDEVKILKLNLIELEEEMNRVKNE